MGKYLAIFRNSIQQTLIYRFNTFSYLTAQILSFGAFFYLWSSIYRQGGEIGGYTLAQLIFYYLGVNFLRLIFKDADIAWTVGDEIRLGNINTFLIQPISYFWRKFYASLGRAVFRTIIALICFGFLVFILAHFNINFSFEWKNLILAFISAMLGFLIDFLFFYIIGLIAFWMSWIMGLNFTMQNVTAFLAGAIIPLDLLPTWFVALNNWLPFKYVSYVPISIFTGHLNPDMLTFFVPVIWIFVLALLGRFIFKRGLKKYEGSGA